MFGLGYLFVIVIHAGLFAQARAGAGLAASVPIFAPLNVIAALVLVGAGFLGGPMVYALWLLAFGLFVVTSVFAGSQEFSIAPGHFVERHGLLLIIVLGESIVAISVGAAGLPLDASLLVVGVLALAVVSSLWWLYFSGDDVHAEEAMRNAPPERRARIALNAFFYAQIPMLLGVVAFAAGVKSAIGHAFEPLPPSASLFLGSGVALYLIGDALFRIWIGWGNATARVVAAFAALAATSLGIINASFELVVLLGIVLAAIVVRLPNRIRDRVGSAPS